VRAFTIGRLEELLAVAPVRTFWRHDVDVSLDAALAMAELEYELGVDATFYLMSTSPFYTAAQALRAAAALSASGHRVGWHVDTRWTPLSMIPRPAAVSFHCPTDDVLWRDFPWFENAYAAHWKGRYVADSRGSFEHGDPEDKFDGEPLQVNLHPEWWFERDWRERRPEVPAATVARFLREAPAVLGYDGGATASAGR
jgi:hypothetical protein